MDRQSATPKLALPDGYTLIWSDEFEADGLPQAHNWQFETQRNRRGWYNDEQQYYAHRSATASNATIEQGRLVIEARRDDFPAGEPVDWGGQRYSSARLTTRGKSRWQGGFFEIRAKLPCARGAWPAIWLLPDSHHGAWRGGEIDIVEAVGHQPGLVHHSLHTQLANFRNGNQLQASSRIDACGAFHDYQLLWTPDRVTIGVDGVPALAGDGTAFERPMSLILNVAIGGNWGGAQGIDDDALPARLEIEYVRIYQPAR